MLMFRPSEEEAEILRSMSSIDDEYMQRLQAYCNEISAKITQSYFQGALKHVA